MTENPTSRRPAHESLGLLLSLVRSEIVRAMQVELAARKLPLSFTQFLILKRLARCGAMTATELARAVELDRGAMTRQLDRLEQAGYLKRTPHAADRRALHIALTPTGEALWRELIDCNARVLDAAQHTLSRDERAHLVDYLERVLAALRTPH